ncbi:MAG: thioredoxin-disulfide reductase [Clostridia bacterium]|jgi:thioredoxin reductase (NADPH)|nr:thioredoxin-disulfide reductase [Clostridia bacterium]
MEQQMWDIVIVGGGPAGMAAGIYASRSKLSAVILEKAKPGGQAATTEEMENYPGFGRGATGPGIMEAMRKHAEDFGTTIIKDEVVDVELDGAVKKVITKSGATYQGKAVILCPGARPRSLNVKGEKDFIGKGVSWCATCDADFFEELDVVVVGNGDAAIEEAMYLTKFAESVSVIVIHDEGILDCNKASAEKAFANPKMKWIWNSVLEEIKGDGIVEKVAIKNLKTGEIWDLETNGVFFFVGTVPQTAFLKDKVELDGQGYIVTNNKMETNVPGVYAAGDAIQKYLRQVVTAAADGAIAAVAAEKYLAEEEAFNAQVLEQELPVAVAFWAPQNENSIQMVSALEQAMTGFEKAKLVKIDVYRNQLTSSRYEVKDIPAVLVFNKGEVKARFEGSFTADEVVQKIDGGLA